VAGTLHKTQADNGEWQLSGTATVSNHDSQVVRITLVNNRAFKEAYDSKTFDPRNDTSPPISQGCADASLFEALADVGTSVAQVCVCACVCVVHLFPVPCLSFIFVPGFVLCAVGFVSCHRQASSRHQLWCLGLRSGAPMLLRLGSW